jgi:hypothetical protein
MLTIPDNAWYTSSRTSGASNCVEVAHVGGCTAVRDSKNRSGPALIVADGQWDAFINDTVARSVI